MKEGIMNNQNNSNDILYVLFDNIVSQCLLSRKNNWEKLPEEQEKALKRILDSVHTICESIKELSPENQKQAQEAFILKVASEFGWKNI